MSQDKSKHPKIFFELPFSEPPQLYQNNRRSVSNCIDAPTLPRPANQQGFTLIELAIGMGVVGLLMASAMAFAKPALVKYHRESTTDRMTVIVKALEDYRTANGHYPCPARPNAIAGSSEYGTAGDCSAPWSASGFGCDADGVCVKAGVPYDHDDNPATLPVDMRVREGSVPWSALSLSVSFAEDAYGMQYRYAVPEVLAADKPTYSKYESLGGIDIVKEDSSSALATPASTRYALISMGANRRGGMVGSTGREHMPCVDGRLETDNCDKSNNARAVYRTAPMARPDGADTSGYYDDFIEWQKPKAAPPSASGLQSFVSDSGLCPDGFSIAYKGRKPVFVNFGRSASDHWVAPIVYAYPDMCLHQDALRASGGRFVSSGGSPLPNYTQTPTKGWGSRVCSQGVALSNSYDGCLGLGNACALCIPATN